MAAILLQSHPRHNRQYHRWRRARRRRLLVRVLQGGAIQIDQISSPNNGSHVWIIRARYLQRIIVERAGASADESDYGSL